MVRRHLCVLLFFSSVVFGLWPFPNGNYETGLASLVVSTTFEFNTTSKSDILQQAIHRYLTLTIQKCPQTSEFQAFAAQVVGSLEINVSSSDETLLESTDESYELTISAASSSIQAATIFGAMHGLETFSQLVTCSGSSLTILNTPIAISDVPRFKHRGLLIDSARHFLPVNLILNTIDAMSFNKLNVLHWHISDAESFPMESLKYPALTKGAYTSKYVYSQVDAAMVVKYALYRGIRVIPEFDTPGHTNSWKSGYPDIVTNCPSFGRNINNINLNPTKPQTMEIVSGFWQEMSHIFSDEYMHIGGDEVEYGCWREDQQVLNWMNQNGVPTFNALMALYEKQLWTSLSASGKKMIAWEEVFNGYNLNIPQNLTIEVWKDEETLLSVAQAGLKGILAYGWYLGELQLTWEDFYLHEPFVSSAWTSQLESQIIGGEACMWGEKANQYNLESKIWPRASATAERLWSNQNLVDIPSAQMRLEQHICLMNARGVASAPIAPGFC